MSELRPPFKEGDLVRLVNGKKPQRVVDTHYQKISGWRIRAAYLEAHDYINYPPKWRTARDYVLYKQADEAEPQENTEMAKLFQVVDDAPNHAGAFGTYLATNSAGEIVLELKGSTVVAAFPRSQLIEVRPYTVSVRVASKSVVDYVSKPGVLSKGDVLLFSDGTFGIVTRLDTKKENAQSLSGARRLVTEPIPAVSADESSDTVEGEADGLFNQPG